MAPVIIRRVPAWVVNGVTVTLGLVLTQCSIAYVAGAQAAQAAIAAAVCASLADVVATTSRVARRVLAAVIASTVAGTVFLVVRHCDARALFLIPTVALIVFATMLIQSWGPKAGTVSFAAALALVFAMSLPRSQVLTWAQVGWGLAGSIGYCFWAVATARLLQPTWRNVALASAADGLADLLAAIGRQIRQPADMTWQSGLLDAEAALAERLQAARDLVFGNDHGPQARLETAVLLHLIDLRDLAMASNLEAGRYPALAATRQQAELTGRVVEAIGVSVEAIAATLRSGTGRVVDERTDLSIRELLGDLEETSLAAHCAAVVGVSSLLRNKLAMLRSLQRLVAAHDAAELPCERDELRRYITPDEWRLAAVRANLHLDAPVMRHALRTCVTATGAYALSRAIPWALHPQWIVLTVMTVMQGNLALTLARRNARVLGTLAGCVLVLALSMLDPSKLFLAGCFLVASGVAHAYFGVRYSVTAAAAAVMALLQAHFASPEGGLSAFERFGDTVTGALLGWAATYALPTWERRNLPAAMKQAVAALRAYAAQATLPGAQAAGMPRFARQRAYDAIRALASTRSRSLVEPTDVRVPIPQLTSWLAAAYGLMAHLSNLRLSLTMHARASATPALVATMGRVSRDVDALLGTMAPARPAAALRIDDEHVLATVAHLLPRVKSMLTEAERVAELATQLEVLVGSPADSRP